MDTTHRNDRGVVGAEPRNASTAAWSGQIRDRDRPPSCNDAGGQRGSWT